jgi:hypothetical protein
VRVAHVARRAAASRDVDRAIATRIMDDMRRLVVLTLFLVGCATAKGTPASRTCNVLNDESQLAQCVGKSVIVRGRVTISSPARIAGVVVDADASLRDRLAHAMGTLERDGSGYVHKDAGGLAKAHAQ